MMIDVSFALLAAGFLMSLLLAIVFFVVGDEGLAENETPTKKLSSKCPYCGRPRSKEDNCPGCGAFYEAA